MVIKYAFYRESHYSSVTIVANSIYNLIIRVINWKFMKSTINQLSKIDKDILRILQDDGRITYAELARQVGLTTTPCIERVRRLERDGFIKQYTTVINPEQLDAGLIVFVQIRLDRTSKHTFAQFKEAVLEVPEVQECYLVSGSFDYLIKVRLADMAAYRLFLEESLLSVPAVQESTSVVVMEAVKETLSVSIP
jgi:Lrp/AsnC family leucine-responsive transcriptional regulator